MKRAIHAVIHFFFWALIADWQKKGPDKRVMTVWSLLLSIGCCGLGMGVAYESPSHALWIVAGSGGALSIAASYILRRLKDNLAGHQGFYGEAQHKQGVRLTGFRISDDYPPKPQG